MRFASIFEPIARIASADGPTKVHTSAACGSEIGVLGQESVTGMNRVGTAFHHGVDDRIDAQITFTRRRRTDPHRTIGRTHVQRIAIRIRIHRNRFDAHAPRGAHDAARDFAAVRDQ